MQITNESDLVLVLRLTDKKNKPMRVADTLSLKVRVFTTDERYALVFNKMDIIQGPEHDKIKIDREDLETLESGVISYSYEYNTLADPEYQKHKDVETDIYFANSCVDPNHSHNIVNYRTIEKLKDAIEKVAAQCEYDIAVIRNYIENEYTNKLDGEIERSIAEDERLLAMIVELQEKADNAGVDSTEIHAVIDEILKKNLEQDTYLGELDNRLESLKSRVESVDKDLDFRIDKCERKLNVLNDSNELTPGSLANAIRQGKDYTDNKFADVRKGLATEKQIEELNDKITPHPTALSSFFNDCGYISNHDIFDNYYNRATVDAQHKEMQDSIRDIESWAARADRVTVVYNSAGEVVREMHISDEPEFYDKGQIDEKLAELKSGSDSQFTELKSEIETLDSRVQEIERIDFDSFATNSSVQEIKSELEGQITTLDSKVDDLSSNVESIDNRVKVLEAIDHNQFADKTETENKFKEIEGQITDTEGKFEGYVTTESFEEKTQEIESKFTNYVTIDSFESKTQEIENNFDNYLKIEDYHEYDDTEIDNRIKSLESIDHSLYATNSSLNQVKTELERKIDNVDLSDYYTKSETYSSEEIDEKLKSVDVTDQLSDYMKVWKGSYDEFTQMGEYDDKTVYCVLKHE